MNRDEAWGSEEWLRSRHQRLEDLGLLEPDQPTTYSHALYRLQMTKDFTDDERRMIRFQLNLGPEGSEG